MVRTKGKTTDEEIRREFDEREASGRDLEGFTQAPLRVSKNLSVVYSLRLSPDEYSLFDETARSRGMLFSDFIRAATLAAAEGEISAEKAAALSAVRTRIRELNEAIGRV